MNFCPKCNETPLTTCRCLRGDSSCENGHVWYYCPVHHKPVLGHSNHSEIFDLKKCYCPKEEVKLQNKMNNKDIYVGLDFDGTVCKHIFPDIGEEVPHCIRVLKRLQDKGYKIILNTMRSEQALTEAVIFLNQKGIILFGANYNPSQENWTTSPKVYAHFYVDDAAIGCPLIYPSNSNERPYVDWAAVEVLLTKQGYLD